MKSAFYATILLAFFIGCGGQTENTPHTPAISNLDYSPKWALVGTGGGFVVVNGLFDFSDPGADLDTMTLTIKNSHGSILSMTTTKISYAYGLRNGLVSVSVTASTATAQSTLFEVYVTDKAGLRSNTLTGLFSVYLSL